jgi:hypothetical protein
MKVFNQASRTFQDYQAPPGTGLFVPVYEFDVKTLGGNPSGHGTEILVPLDEFLRQASKPRSAPKRAKVNAPS